MAAVKHFAFPIGDTEAERSLGDGFRSAKPFPHLVLDDVIATPKTDVLAAFPDPEWEGWKRYGDAYQPNKMIFNDLERLPSLIQEMVVELCAPEFLQFLERVTGIGPLLPDPYLEGGGMHCSGPGGVLTPHTDFHYYANLDLFRRINVLVYLNDDWSESDGGNLALYADKRAEEPSRRVTPVYGRCVVFQTDHDSVHGFPDPVKEGKWRRSLALYYYTSKDAEKFSGDTTTYWRQHGAKSATDRARLGAYRTLLFGSRVLSYAAHRANPNFDRTRGNAQ